jgi:hypothetical protein
LESFFVASAPKVKKGVVKKMLMKKFKKGQYVRVVHRKKPYIGTYYGHNSDQHIVHFAGSYVYITNEKMIFPVEGLEEKRT